MGAFIRYLPSEYASGTINRRAISFWVGRSRMRYFDVAKRLAMKGCPRAKSFLDVGGGSCRFLDKFKGKRVVADIDPRGNIYPSSSRVGYRVTRGNLKRFKTNSFDVVFCLQVIEHGKIDPAELFRVARLGVVISYPHMWGSGSSHHRRLNKKWLIKKVGCKPNSFQVVKDGKNRGVAFFKARRG